MGEVTYMGLKMESDTNKHFEDYAISARATTVCEVMDCGKLQEGG